MTTTRDDSAPSAQLNAGDWTVDAAHSQLGFKTKAMGFLPVRGSYGSFEGELHVAEGGAVSGTLRVESATVATGIKKRDAHLRSPDFFHVEAHPDMTFDLAGLSANGDGTWRLTGTLHILGRKVPMSAPVNVVSTDSQLKLTSDFEIDHKAAGFAFKKLPKKVQINADLTLKPGS